MSCGAIHWQAVASVSSSARATLGLALQPELVTAQGDPVGRVVVADDVQRAHNGDLEAYFLHPFARDGLFRRFAGLHAAAGEFPQPAPDVLFVTALDEDFPFMQEHPAHYLNLRDGGFLAGNRAFVLDAEVAAFAQPGQRAAFALGLFAAYERAQFP